ncbi:MAG: recombination protein O N-terminal domain-containing protein [Candidatus Harrisonbacteria bacterium]|nr:recombination protein O N-terminal domain-containing protein [Candidatus Harrisonbacteria bacterium]
MIEVITEAIVLKKEDLGEHDSRVFLFTKDLGRISTKATSLRKITSKLASHLEPHRRVTVRLVSKKDIFDGRSFQLVDALAIDVPEFKRVGVNKLREALVALDFLAGIVPEAVPDFELWNFLNEIIDGTVSATKKDILKFLGLDPEFANCQFCFGSQPEFFYASDNLFVCRSCSLSSQVSKEKFILI